MKAYEAIAAAFVAEGVDTVFALLGDGNMIMLADLVERHGVRLVNTRHENAAVAMADGWARTANRVGVCSVTCGPGLTQVCTALTAAVRNRTPLVLFAGDLPAGAAWNPQNIDQGLAIAATGAVSAPIRSLETVGDTVRNAFLAAQRDRVPVVVSMPYDLQELELPGRFDYEPSQPLPALPQTPEPGPADVAAAAERLAAAERPIIVAGRGAVAAGAREAILALADRTGSLVGTTLLARDWFRGEPFDIGLVGGLSARTTRDLLGECDLVLAVGASLGYFTTDNGKLLAGIEVIQVDTEPKGVTEGVRAATSTVRGDARVTVTRIDAVLAERGHHATGFRSDSVRQRLARPLPEYPVLTPEPGTVDPAAVIDALDSALPPEPLLVLGVGHFWSFAVMGMHRPAPADHLYAYGFGAVGHGLPTAIGAAVAARRPVVLIEGDGSLLMHVGELATVAAEGLDLLVVVMNDGGFGSEIHKLNAKGANGELARFGQVDFAAVAEGFGITGHRLASAGEVEGLLGEHLERGGPTLIDVPMSRDALSAPTRRALFPHTLPD